MERVLRGTARKDSIETFETFSYRLGYRTLTVVLGGWLLALFGSCAVGLFLFFMDLGSGVWGDGAYDSFGFSGASLFDAYASLIEGIGAKAKAAISVSLLSAGAMAWAVDRSAVVQFAASIGTIVLHIMLLGAIL